MKFLSFKKLKISQISISKPWQGIVAFLIVAILFGSEPAITKQVTLSVKPTAQIAIRYLAALIIFMPWIIKILLNIRPIQIAQKQLTGQTLNLKIWAEETPQGNWVINRALLRDGCVLGLLTCVIDFCFSYGVQSISANRASFLLALCVIVVMLLDLVYRRRFSLRIFWAAILGFSGSGLMFWEQSSEPLIGSLLILGVVLCEATLLIFLEDIAAGHHPQTLSVVRQGVATIPALGVAGAELSSQIPEIQVNLLPLFYLGSITAVTTWLIVFALQTLTAAESALIQGLEPVFGATISFLVLGEVFGWRGLIGCGLILSGTTLAILTKSQQLSELASGRPVTQSSPSAKKID